MPTPVLVFCVLCNKNQTICTLQMSQIDRLYLFRELSVCDTVSCWNLIVPTSQLLPPLQFLPRLYVAGDNNNVEFFISTSFFCQLNMSEKVSGLSSCFNVLVKCTVLVNIATCYSATLINQCLSVVTWNHWNNVTPGETINL